MKAFRNKSYTAIVSLFMTTSALSSLSFAEDNGAQNVRSASSNAEYALPLASGSAAVSVASYGVGTILKKQSEKEYYETRLLERKTIENTQKPYREELKKLETPEALAAEQEIKSLRGEYASLSTGPIDVVKNYKRLTKIEGTIADLVRSTRSR